MGAQDVVCGSRPGTLLGRSRRSLLLVLLRRVWVPRALYEAVPALYLAAGTGALWSALYLPGWTWILCYLALFGLACLHAGVAIAGRRYRSRRSRSGQ